MSKETCDKFFLEPDHATKKKIEVVMKYFGIYFSIIEQERVKQFKRWNKNPRIVYVDLFSGPGVFKDGTESVPVRLLKYMKNKKTRNMLFYFNDLNYSDELKHNLLEISHLIPNMKNIIITPNDAKTIEVSSLFKNNDIVISYVDPFSYIKVDPETISNLVSNYFSDCLFFLNLQYFFRFIEQDKENLIDFFGDEITYDEVASSIRMERNHNIAIGHIIRAYANKLESLVGDTCILPIFFRKSHAETQISQSLFLVSKDPTGIMRLKDQLYNFEHIFFEKGRYIVYEADYTHKEHSTLFYDDETYLLKYIPKDDSINVKELIDKIDNDYIDRFGYYSAFNNKNVKILLDKLEIDELIDVIPKKRRMYKDRNTYGDKTKFKRVV